MPTASLTAALARMHAITMQDNTYNIDNLPSSALTHIAVSLCAPIVGVNLELKKSQNVHLHMKGRAMNVDWTWL